MTKQTKKIADDLGPFHTTSLLIRRVRELMNGSPALVEAGSGEPVMAAFEELASGKFDFTDEVLTKD